MCRRGLCQRRVTDCQRLPRRRRASAKRSSCWQEQRAKPGPTWVLPRRAHGLSSKLGERPLTVPSTHRHCLHSLSCARQKAHTHTHLKTSIMPAPPHPRPDLGPKETKENKVCAHSDSFAGTALCWNRTQSEEGGKGSTAEFNVSLRRRAPPADVELVYFYAITTPGGHEEAGAFSFTTCAAGSWFRTRQEPASTL